MASVKDKRVSEFRTICEVHRELYDELVNLAIDNKSANKLIGLLEEAYKMGKKMDNKLRQHKYGYDDNWWQENRNFKASFERRKHGKKRKIRKVYIDCGAWTGDSIEVFKKHHKGYDIYAFECEPRLKEVLEQSSQKHCFVFINKAVWINDNGLNLYPGVEDYTQSSSVYFSKKKLIDKKNPVFVQSIDFSQWILDNFDEYDYIICKMNIEGAEYDVLEKMLTDGSIRYINRLYVAWHHNKLKDFSEARHKKIEKRVKDITELLVWNFEDEDGNPF